MDLEYNREHLLKPFTINSRKEEVKQGKLFYLQNDLQNIIYIKNSFLIH